MDDIGEGWEHARAKALLSARDGNLATLNSVLENVSDLRKKELLSGVVKQYNQVYNPLIIAAANDHFSVVELLGRKYKTYVDVNKGGTIYHKECLRHNMNALCCAASNGNLDMVKLLVEELGANVNYRSEYNITAVRDACTSGHVDIVKYLVSHGADIFLKHQYNQSTCLIEAIANGHFEVAEFLLEEGLDPDIPTTDTGMTAMHFACSQPSCDLVRSLIDRGASIYVKDMRGLTPVDHACEARNDKVAGEFQYSEKVGLSKESTVRMLELLGAACIISERYVTGFYGMMHGMKERFDDSRDIIYKSGLIMVENDSLLYGNRRESFTEEELEELRDDEEGLKREAILVMERTLGEHHFLLPEVILKDFCKRATNYESLGRHMDALTLLMKVLHVREKTQKSNWQVIEQFLGLFAEMQRVAYILDPSVVMHVFEYCLADLEQEWLRYQYVEYEPVRDESMEILSKQVRNVLNLIAVVKCMAREESEDYLDIRLARFVTRFLDVGLYLDPNQKASILHIACSGVSSKFQQLRSPNLDVLELLLAKGADINATDQDGNTPLHVLASYNGSDDKTIFDVTVLFVQSGAHLDAKNNEGLRPLDLASPVIVDELKEHTKKVPLKCMAAQAVKLHLKNYADLLPPALFKFVEQH